jgi:dTMP kinase
MLEYMELGTIGASQPEKGLLIVFEGGDGTGKGEMMSRAQRYIRGLGYYTKVTKDPGGTQLGQSVRNLLFVDPSTRRMAPGVSDMLFLASHLQNWLGQVEGYLNDGGIVLSDRWWYSQFVYGSHRWCMPEIMTAYKKYHGPRANLLIFLHGDPEACLSRANSRTELHQSGKVWNNVADFRKIQQTYFDMFAKLPEFWPIDANQELGEVWCEVRAAINRTIFKEQTD